MQLSAESPVLLARSSDKSKLPSVWLAVLTQWLGRSTGWYRNRLSLSDISELELFLLESLRDLTEFLMTSWMRFNAEIGRWHLAAFLLGRMPMLLEAFQHNSQILRLVWQQDSLL